MRFPRLIGGRKPAAPEPAATSDRVEPVPTRRSYKAATPGRLVTGFKPFGASTPREDTRREIRGLVSHARHAAHNFDHARAYEMLIRRHVVGPGGIRLQMDVREPDGRPDKRANAQIEAAWKQWGRKGGPTICGRWSWWGVECMVATGIAREGGAFVRLHRGRKGGPFGLRVEVLPFDLLDLDLTQPLPGGAYIEAGIEFDEDGRPLAYHLWSAPQGVGHQGTRRRIRVPAQDMTHVLVPEEAGQALGVPRSATALRLMNMGEQYRESGLAAAHFGAAAMGFFERDEEGDELAGSTEGEDDKPPIDKMEAGTLMTLPPGVKYSGHNPKYPEAAVGPFMRHMYQSEASGLGVSYETLTSDLSGANFSSLRAGKAEERDEWRMLQRAVHESLHDVVFREWLQAAMLTGRISLPFAKLDKFDAPTWRPRGWAAVNPKDDAAAAETDLRNGIRSRREIIAERGRDIEDVDAELTEEKPTAESLGLGPAAAPPASPPAPDPGGDTDPPE